MSLWETRLEIPAALADEVDGIFQDCGVEGWTLLEDAIARRAWIIGIFPSESEALLRWEEIRPSLPVPPATVPQLRPLPDEDWKNSYKSHFKAWAFGRLHWVPVWERESFQAPEGHAVLWLDPGLAFGTGNHETTRLCIERLVARDSAQGEARSHARVVDAGCGSGILALSACLLGYKHVSGFDNDPEAVRVSYENATLNGLSGAARFSTCGLSEGLSQVQADIILANIQADVLLAYASVLTGAVAPGGMLAMSGILASERDKLIQAFGTLVPSWSLESRILGEWCDLVLNRPS